jgi:HK97 family phage major capsid protein
MGSASALNADGLIEVQNALKEGYQPGAAWGMKRTTFGAALQLKGADNYFFSPVLLANGQATMQLLGKPVIFMDDMPAVAANALSVVYADFSVAYTICDRVGLQVLRDPYTNKGFVTYYTTQRVGGDVTNFDGIAIGKVAA